MNIVSNECRRVLQYSLRVPRQGWHGMAGGALHELKLPLVGGPLHISLRGSMRCQWIKGIATGSGSKEKFGATSGRDRCGHWHHDRAIYFNMSVIAVGERPRAGSLTGRVRQATTGSGPGVPAEESNPPRLSESESSQAVVLVGGGRGVTVTPRVFSTILWNCTPYLDVHRV